MIDTQAFRWAIEAAQRRTRSNVLIHAVVRRPSGIQVIVVPDKKPLAEDVAIAARLLVAYQRVEQRESLSPGAERSDLWTRIRGGQADFLSLLGRGDAEELAAYLCNFSRHDAGRGVVQGDEEYERIPGARIRLYGETPQADDLVIPADALSELNQERYDLVLNQDAFPEMHQSVVREYLIWMRRARVGRFLSINHESKSRYGRGSIHVTVPEEVQRVGGFQRLSRFPYWLRKGYVAELYRVTEH